MCFKVFFFLLAKERVAAVRNDGATPVAKLVDTFVKDVQMGRDGESVDNAHRARIVKDIVWCREDIVAAFNEVARVVSRLENGLNVV